MFLGIPWVEWVGYLASTLVLVSLLMGSIIKLRWINLIGSSVFSVYGFLIGALPVGFMNLFIAGINIYYLIKIYRLKEYFQLMPVEKETTYLEYFLKFHAKGIERYSDGYSKEGVPIDVGFFVLRNMVPAGIFLASHYSEQTLKVNLDFVIPEYRDFKIGQFIFRDKKSYFHEKGYTKLICFASNEKHVEYLEKMGFTKDTTQEQTRYLLELK
ncbi:hypothetical protein QBE53_02615 [Vallitaleaceae bacterium 9-2]|mgnify:CR=1 FL=1